MNAPDQRRYPRIRPPKSVVAAWQAGTKRDVSYVESLGIGGLYLRTKERVPLRCLVKVLLDLPAGQVRGRAVVRRVRDGHGMAVQFIAMDPSDRARLFYQMKSLLVA